MNFEKLYDKIKFQLNQQILNIMNKKYDYRENRVKNFTIYDQIVI